MRKHKLLLQIAALLMFSAFLTPVFAQDETGMPDVSELSETEEQEVVIKDVEGLRLQLYQHTQNPYNKEVRFDLIISSEITSDRVTITWEVSGTSELVTAKTQSVSVQPGNTYSISGRIKPRAYGITNLVAKVEAFRADGTYLATASKLIGTYPSGDVFPITSEYRTAQIIYYVQVGATWITAALVVYVVARLGYNWYRNWRDTKEVY